MLGGTYDLGTKSIIKRLVKFINVECFTAYQIYTCRRQIKSKFLKSTDYLSPKDANETLEYWRHYGCKPKLYWHKWYSSRNGIVDKRYIPEDIFYGFIIPFYNKIEFQKAYADKALHSIWFPNMKRPTVIAKNLSGAFYNDVFTLITLEEVYKHCENKKELIIKPTIQSGGGRDIKFISADNDQEMKEKLARSISYYQKDFIIQEVLEQHDTLNKINPSSINTIRVMSFFNGNNVVVLSSVLRMGINGARIDNMSAGGISCGIHDNGHLKSVAYDKYGNIFKKHPQGFIFKEGIIPNYNDIKEVIKNEHKKFGHFRLISWDIAIEKDGYPVLIEFNLGSQGLNFHQLNNGPLFADLTDEVLNEVFNEK